MGPGREGHGGDALMATSARIAVVLFGPEGRGSFNESGVQGAERARAAGHALQVHWVTPQGAEDRAEALRAILRTGVDLLVAHGGQGDAPVQLVHAEFPQVAFAITQGGFEAFNVACYEVLQEQSAFLGGVLAALSSRTGIVGHMSGEKVRPGLKGRAAYAQGVAAAGNGCQLLTTFCGHQHDPELAYAVTAGLQRAGADYVFAMIDGGRDGVSRACRALPMRQIGNVLDWVARDPLVFVASAWCDSGRCIHEAIEDFVQDRLAPGSTRVHGVEDPDFVRLVLAPDVPAAQRLALEPWIARMAAGEWKLEGLYEGPEFDWRG